MSEKRIVITGVGVIAPNGIGKDEFWQALRNGASGIKPITVFDPSLFKTRTAGEVSNFNAENFLEVKGLRTLDRSTKFLCSAAKLALDDAGLKITGENTDEIGVATATTLSVIWNITEFSQEAADDGPQFVNPVGFPGTTINAPSSQVSIRFNIKGFNSTISTGFTAGLDALKYAADFIRLGRAKAVLVAGVETLSFQNFVGFYNLKFLSGINGIELCCPFDRRRNGISLGEGAAVLVIEDEEFALKRKARIYANLLSVESSFDAFRSGKYQPRAEGLKRAISKALKNSALNKEDLSYICAASNSVLQQDKLETMAIKEVFQDAAQKIPVSSIKSMLGESLSASGALQICASIGAMEQNFIPPTINYKEPDPECCLDYVPNTARDAAVKNVLINNFGPGGSNVASIISKYNG